MDLTYFRYESHSAQGWWDRRSFLRNWWRIYRKDPYWVPPYYPALRQALTPGRHRHLERMRPLLIHIEALARRSSGSRQAYDLDVSPLPVAVAATVVLSDPRREDGTAYLALPRAINDAGSLIRLLEELWEALASRGIYKVLGPTGLSPHLGSGLLQDHWDRLPPLHTAYNPPYLPEIAATVLHPRRSGRLYRLEIPPEPPPEPPAPAALRPLHAARLATDLRPLLAAACPPWADFAPPDEAEAAFLLEWIGRWPLIGWLAEVEGEPVGFVLMQPDLAPRLRLARGGRSPVWRLWLAWAGRHPIRQGRVLFAGVLPSRRGQGIGLQLLHRTIRTARQQGWQTLSIGPLPLTGPGPKFLKRHGAEAQQSYLLYEAEL